MKKLRFDELNLSDDVLRAVSELGFEEATPIQSETIPLLMQGKDVTGHAQTGTGKTAAFAIPIIEMIDESQKNIQAIILCPTRELVIQVSDELRKLAKFKENLSVVSIYGGQDIERQLKLLRKFPQIIVGTPGRTIDHLNRRTLKTQYIRFVILDEADEMLDMGFRDDIERILKDAPDVRQTIMFSATMPEDIMQLMKKYQKNAIIVDVTSQKINAPKIEQVYFDIQESLKPEALSRLIDLHNIKLALVVCNTKNQVDILAQIVKSRGYFAEGLHGDMNQNQREKVMRDFRNGNVEILVATDVAGRGLDVNNIEAVFNYDLPRDDEDYVHRIGRTGRAGKTGISFTFVVGKQIYALKRIERMYNLKISRSNIPTITELDAAKYSLLISEVKDIINNERIGKYVVYIEQLLDENYTSIDIAAALLKLIIDEKNEGIDESISDFSGENKGSKKEKRNRDGRKSKFNRKGTSFKKEKFKSKRNNKLSRFQEKKDRKRKKNK